MFKKQSETPFQKRIGLSITLALIVFGVTVAELRAQPEKIAKSFAEITKKVEPAVVSIDTKGRTPQIAAKDSVPPSDGSDIMDFFRRQMQQRPVHALGSGFIVDKSGYIVTNAHVIEDAARITVRLDSGEEFIAKVVGTDEPTDIAILKINAPRDLPFVKFGDSDKSEVGDWVLAIGSPFGLTKTVTAGIISQKQRETPNSPGVFRRFIQTDAAINRGNSGGPLVNLDGEVIGVNSQIATSTGDYNGIGFALPSRDTENVYGQIVRNGKVRRGYLGAYLDSVKAEFARVYGLKDAKGAVVTEIRDKQSPAALAGLLPGDIITEFNGKSVESAQDLISKIASTPPDQTVTLGFIRENGANLDAKNLSIKLRERPGRVITDEDDSDRRVLPIDGVKGEQKPFGLTLSELSPVLVEKYKLGNQKGLVVKEINQASFIADVKDSLGGDALGEGDLIQRVNRLNVSDLKAFNETVSKLKVGDAVVLHIITYNPRAGIQESKIVQFTVR